MNVSLVAALAFFFGLAAASLAARVVLDDASSRERTKTASASRPHARTV